MILSTLINSETHDYDLLYGIFKQSNALLTEAYSMIVVPIGTYIFDPGFGSFIPSWINSRQQITSQKIIDEINRALTPLIGSKRAKSIGIKINSILMNGFSVTISIVDMDNTNWVLPINYFAISNLKRIQGRALTGGS